MTKTFLIIAEQGGGCDYTIGCGIDYWTETADSLEDLKKEIKFRLMGSGEENWYDFDDYKLNPSRLNLKNNYESVYNSLTIYELGAGEYNVPLDKITKEYEDMISKKQEKEEEDEERAEYERLKEKFEGKKQNLKNQKSLKNQKKLRKS